MFPLHIIMLAILAALLLVAIVTDCRTRTIANGLNGAIAAGAPLWWWVNGIALWPDIAILVAQATVALAIFTAMFALGAMGGGDVKMIAALGLWFGPLRFLNLISVMAIAGGLLTVAMLVHHRVRNREDRPEIPYGVAIGFAALVQIYQTIF